MPRKGSVSKREVLQDPLYGEVIITKLINQVMYDGKKGVAQSICYDAFNMIAEKTGKDPMEVFMAAMNNIMLEDLVVQHIRFRWRSVLKEDRLSVSDGSLLTQEQETREQ